MPLLVMLGLDAAPAPSGMLICYAVLPLRVFVCRSRPSGRAFRAEIVCTVNMFIANAINGNDDKAGGGAAGLVQISHLNCYTKLMFVRLCVLCVKSIHSKCDLSRVYECCLYNMFRPNHHPFSTVQFNGNTSLMPSVKRSGIPPRPVRTSTHAPRCHIFAANPPHPNPCA